MIMETEFDLALLRTFVAMIETGGLTSAGRLVGRTQPAISHQAKRLEAAVGRPLFGPDKRHLTLTREGEILLEYARSMLRLNDELRARYKSPDVQGHVTLGTPDLYAAYLLPTILGNFSRTFPGIEIELRCQRSIHLISALRDKQIDLAILTRQPDHRTGQVVRREPLVWVASSAARPELEPILPLAVLPAGSVYRQHTLDALGGMNRRWVIASISDSIAGLHAAVYAGLAVAVVPLCAVSPALRRLSAADGFPSLPAIDLVMVRKSKDLNPAATQLANYIAQRIKHAYPLPYGPREGQPMATGPFA